MKKLIIALALVLMTTSASAAWRAAAHSPSAYGWAVSNNLQRAKDRALSECASRTPWGEVCYITSWYWVD